MDPEGTRGESAAELWSSGSPRSVGARRAALALSILLGVVFLVQGLSKLMGREATFEEFERWGYPAGFVYVVGVGETLAAVLVLVPRTRFWGAAGLVLDMTGAVLTHINADEWPFVPVPGTLLLAAAALTVLTRPPALRDVDASAVPPARGD